MKTAVVGAGAMGSIFAAAFLRAGNDVLLIDVDQALVDALNATGLEIGRPDGTTATYAMPATTDPASIGDVVDLVLFEVKGYATQAAAELAAPVVGPGTIVLTLQNGLGNEEILRAAYPGRPVLIGNSFQSAAVLGPGRVQHTAVRGTTIGPAEDQWSEHAEATARALAGSDLECHVVTQREIRRQNWAKFVLTCGSLPVQAITGLAAAEVAAREVLLDVVDRVVRESCAIAQSEGIEIDADERVAALREAFRTGAGKASMLQDIEAHRRTEVDTISGAAIRYAEKNGVPAPMNRVMFALVKGREAAVGVRS
jgi:2-dehydropantoate 2-reductase